MADRKPNHLTPLEERIHIYIPDFERLSEYPSPTSYDLEQRKDILDRSPKARYAIVGDDRDAHIEMLPPHHPLAAIHPAVPGHHYGQLAFEGGAAYPKLNNNGEVIGANFILKEQREQRFIRSINALGMAKEQTRQMLANFSQASLDLGAVLSSDVLITDDGQPTRAYFRPTATRIGKWGVTPSPSDYLRLDALLFIWGNYLAEDAYINGARVAGFPDSIRYAPLKGKLSGNYTTAGEVGLRAREMSTPNYTIHEGAYFAPFWIDPSSGERKSFDFEGREEIILDQIVRGGILADGPGMDVVFFGADGTMYYQPKELTHILAGTTRSYIINYLAPHMGVRTQERLVTLNDVRSKEIISAAYVGNAAEFCTLKEIVIADSERKIIEEIPLEVTKTTSKMSVRYARELRGLVKKTSGPLLTPIKVNEGLPAKRVLDEIFSAWN